MTFEFNLPDIGEGLHEAEVVNWLVAVGDTVDRNQPFVEILTDKSTVEMPAPTAGVVARLGVAEGEIVHVGELLVVIEENESAAGRPAAPTTTTISTSTTTTTAPTAREVPTPASLRAASPPTTTPTRRPKASPSTRRLAASLGVDLATITGTGPGGRITADDVSAAARPTATSAAPPTTAAAGSSTARTGAPGLGPGVHPLRGVRRATAKAMDHSWSTIPHINAVNEVDAEHLLSTRAQLKVIASQDTPKVTPLVLVLMAIARSLRSHPMLNANLDLDAETITVHDRVNIGVAVATEHGLLVPVIADADRLGVQDMAAELTRVTTAARDRTIRPEELRGGTHTVTNFGSHGTQVATPIIRPGEAAITGLGAIAPRPFVVDGQVKARSTMSVVVAADHRLVDGDGLSAFHNEICRWIQAPVGLFL